MDKIYKHSRLYLYGFLAIVGLIAIFWGFMDGYRGTGSCISMGIIYIILAAIYYPVLKRIFLSSIKLVQLAGMMITKN